MIELGPATEHDMVLAFLQAEVDSPRFAGHYEKCFDQLRAFGVTRQVLIDNPNVASPQHNGLRIALLRAVRGYRANQALFTGFPPDVMWRRVALTLEDFPKLKYAKYETWVILSGRSRLVIDGANNVGAIKAPENPNENIKAVAEEVKGGKRFPELIVVDGDKSEIILIEGHTRATAYALAHLPERIECIAGSSPTMRNWAFY